MKCTRRARSLWPTCRCDDCVELTHRMAKRVRTGRYRRVTSDQAWARLDVLLAQGYRAYWIASAAGLHENCVQNALQAERRTGLRQRFGPGIAAAIVNADMATATAGLRDATGTRRRLQALAVNGYGLQYIADRTGLPLASVQGLRCGSIEQTRPVPWRAVRDLFDELGDDEGPNRQAASKARALDWLPPIAWDDPDTDPAPPKPVGRRPDSVDEVTVIRLVEHQDPSVARQMTKAERIEATRRWRAAGRTLLSLERLAGWETRGYVEDREAHSEVVVRARLRERSA